MSTPEALDTGLIYKNPRPHVQSVHGYFPSVAYLSDQQMVATVVLAEAFEATNARTYLCRSMDLGKTWKLEAPLAQPVPDRLLSDSARITALSPNDLVAFMMRCDRTEHPEEGLTNPDTLGFVPTEPVLLHSKDAGRSWSTPRAIPPPLAGPAFELCAPVTVLRDGRWLIPTHTWPGWDGDCPNGKRMVAFVSHDQGQTWPEYLGVMHDPSRTVYFWESKIVEMDDGRLLAVAWAYDADAAHDLPNQYAISHDGGATWTSPQSTALQGQTLTPLLLPDGRILCVFRRMDQPGLWAVLAHLEGDAWVNEEYLPLWGTQATGLTATTENMAHNFNVLRFGAPSLVALPDNTIFVAFWCYEDCISVIRWLTLGLV